MFEMSEKICYYNITREASSLEIITSWIFFSTHVSIDSVKLEFSGWGRTDKSVHKNWKIKSSIFATDQPDTAQADFEKECMFKNKFENSLIHCECLMERDQEMSLKYIEYRNLLFRWGFPSFRSRFPSELTWFWQKFCISKLLVRWMSSYSSEVSSFQSS